MKKQTNIQIFICLGILFCAIKPIKAQTVRLAYIEFYPLFYTEDGIAKGELVELAKAVTLHASYKLRSQSFPTTRMIQMMTLGKMDLWVGLPNLQAFEGKVLVGKTKITSIELNSYRLSSSAKIDSPEDLIGQRVILLRAYSYGGLISQLKDRNNGTHISYASSHKAGLLMLKYGRADYLIDYKRPIEGALAKLEKNALPRLKIDKLNTFNVHFVVSKKPLTPPSFCKTSKILTTV